ncbi:MAG: hypothetical protein ACOYL6_06385 [Bacteriovoracaceae bacterium]
MKRFTIFLFCLFLSACSDDNFKKVYKLQNLRVIAITAGKQGTLTQAEFAPGDTATLEAFVSDIDSGRTITAVIATCSDLGVSYGREPTCDNVADKITYADITLNTGGVAGNTGAMPTFDVTIPATVLLGRSAADQFNGVNYLVTMKFSTSDGETVKAFKRLTVTTRATKNSNPSIGSIVIDNSSFATYPGAGDFSLSASSSEETYDFQSANGSISNLSEEMNVAWYVSDGEINFPVTGRTGLTHFKPGDKGILVVAAVIRDGRGGMAVTIKKVP